MAEESKLSDLVIEKITPDDYYTWDKEEFIQKNIESKRTNNWYKLKYQRNINLAFIFSILTFVFTLVSIISFKMESTKVINYITMTDGSIIKLEVTPEEREKIQKVISQ
jgi:hypothetical protein